jgi:hypothetical protein
MQIKSYNRAELIELIDSDFFKNLNRLPISKHRALSHTKNPDAHENDELLWAAWQNEQLTGYVGVLPGFINVNRERKKIFWLSCFWVDEHFRKENVASLLFFPLIKKYKEQLFISNFLPNLEKTYQKLGFFKPTMYKTGNIFYFKSCLSDFLPARFPKIRFLKPLFFVADFIINKVTLCVRCSKKNYKTVLPVISKVVLDTNFDTEFQDFLLSFYEDKNFVERFSAHFEWILDYPWVLQGKPDIESKKYYFSSKSEQFCYNFVKFYRNDELSAFLLLKTRDQKLTLSYVFAEDEMLDDIVSYILKKTSDENLLMITCFDERISKKIRNYRIRYLFERSCKRAYILPKTQDITPDKFQEGDGDNVFT